MHRTLRIAGTIVTQLVISAPLRAACQLQKYSEIPVMMQGTSPIITGSINGVAAHFLADSGMFYSTLLSGSAEKFSLKVNQTPLEMTAVTGWGGSEDIGVTTAKEFSLVGFVPGKISEVEFIVSARHLGSLDGLIGQNFIGHGDTEYDLANGVIRLFRAVDCGRASLAYWAGQSDAAVIDIDKTTDLSPGLIGRAILNGARIRVQFDTGSARSILTLKAAARAGVGPTDPNVISGGITRGIGPDVVDSWIARFKSLDLGGEQINNPLLRFGNGQLGENVDMLLGADFFLSHRVYVSKGQRKIYFTFNGGRVFDLSVADRSSAGVAVATDDPAIASDAADTRAAPADAAGYKRRGAASAARGNLRGAIADFDKAIQLDPTDAESFYQRGVARSRRNQQSEALDDFDRALKLKPDDIQSLVARASIRLDREDQTGASRDFDAAINLAPDDAGLALRIANDYVDHSYFEAAISRLDQWIASHPQDERMPDALNSRCWSRAKLGRGLEAALADCTAALKARPRNAAALDSRGLVWLRLGSYDKAIDDYSAALSLQPKEAWSLYGLGLAEVKSGSRELGNVSIQAARSIDAGIADEFKELGLVP